MELTASGVGWASGEGADGDIIISTRVRLARNLAGLPFLTHCSPEQRRELAATLQQTLTGLDLPRERLYVDLESATVLERQLLVERHLISRQQADASGPRGLAIADNETVAVMVCEEDHLRLQALGGALRLEECFARARAVDEQLERVLSFAFSSRFGYLTACPTNIGTALRISIMMHLPALKMTGEIEKALRAARDMHLAVRGLYGEGTEAVGDFFQVSNQTTLGRSEEQIVAEFRERIAPALIDYERRARHLLLANRRLALEDKVFRAEAILKSARMLSSEEAMYLLSHLRLGASLGLLGEPKETIRRIDQLSLMIQPAHLQRLAGKAMPPVERGQHRADYVRHALGAK